MVITITATMTGARSLTFMTSMPMINITIITTGNTTNSVFFGHQTQAFG